MRSIFVHRRIGWTLLAGLTLIAGYLLFWYIQSPVSAGVYPGRVAGLWVDDFSHDGQGSYQLPVIWVRPHPFAEAAPWVQEAALISEDGLDPYVTRGGSPALQWLHGQRPLWLRERAVRGTLALPFRDAPFTATGLRIQWEGAAEQRFQIGKITLHTRIKDEQRFAPRVVQSANQFKEPASRELVGTYLYLVGTGTLLDVVPAFPGMDGTPEGLRYKAGREEFAGNLEPYKSYAPLTLPMEITEPVTLYLPLSAQGLERMQDTHFSTRHALVIQADDGPVTLASGPYSWGVAADWRGWRSWVPYYIYRPSP